MFKRYITPWRLHHWVKVGLSAVVSIFLMYLIVTGLGAVFASLVFALVVAMAMGRHFSEPQRIQNRVRERTLALQDLAYRDGLTGLPNRRFFSWYLEHYIPEQRAAGLIKHLHSQVVLFDLNGFKAVNDTYGHEAGDELLKLIADTLASYLPEDTLLARLGGDEFVVLVRDRARGRKIHTVVKTIRQAARSTMIFNHHRIQVSASVGVSRAVASMPNSSLLLREADEKMYADKASQKAQRPARRLSENSDRRETVRF